MGGWFVGVGLGWVAGKRTSAQVAIVQHSSCISLTFLVVPATRPSSCSVVGVPKSIDNDILLIDKTFGWVLAAA